MEARNERAVLSPAHLVRVPRGFVRDISYSEGHRV